jgi:hypothetical protein
VIKAMVGGCVLLAAGMWLAGCSEPVKEKTPKYEGADFKYHSKGADGYGPPNAVRKSDQ